MTSCLSNDATSREAFLFLHIPLPKSTVNSRVNKKQTTLASQLTQYHIMLSACLTVKEVDVKASSYHSRRRSQMERYSFILLMKHFSCCAKANCYLSERYLPPKAWLQLTVPPFSRGSSTALQHCPKAQTQKPRERSTATHLLYTCYQGFPACGRQPIRSWASLRKKWPKSQ